MLLDNQVIQRVMVPPEADRSTRLTEKIGTGYHDTVFQLAKSPDLAPAFTLRRFLHYARWKIGIHYEMTSLIGLCSVAPGT